MAGTHHSVGVFYVVFVHFVFDQFFFEVLQGLFVFVFYMFHHKYHTLKNLFATNTWPYILLIILTLLLYFLLQLSIQLFINSSLNIGSHLTHLDPLLIDIHHLLVPVRDINNLWLSSQPEMNTPTFGSQHSLIIVFSCAVVAVGVHFPQVQ